MRKTFSWKTALLNLDLAIAIVCMVVLTLITSGGTVMRYFLNAPLIWEEEIQMILVIQIVFWGASAAFRARSHIMIEILVDALPAKWQRLSRGFADAVTAGVLVLLIWIEAERVTQLLASGRVTSILKIPQAYNYAGITLACVFMLYHFVKSEIGYWKGSGRDET